MLSPALLLLPLLASPAAARLEKEFNVGLSPGYAVPLGASARTYGNSPAVRAHIEDEFPSIINGRGGLEVGYQLGHALDADKGSSVSLVQATPYIRATRERGAAEFYSLLGAGYYRNGSADGASASAAAINAGSRHHFGLNVGAGVERWFGEWAVGLDLRYHHVFTPGDNLQFLAPAARLSYGF